MEPQASVRLIEGYIQLANDHHQNGDSAKTNIERAAQARFAIQFANAAKFVLDRDGGTLIERQFLRIEHAIGYHQIILLIQKSARAVLRQSEMPVSQQENTPENVPVSVEADSQSQVESNRGGFSPYGFHTDWEEFSEDRDLLLEGLSSRQEGQSTSPSLSEEEVADLM